MSDTKAVLIVTYHGAEGACWPVLHRLRVWSSVRDCARQCVSTGQRRGCGRGQVRFRLIRQGMPTR